MIQRDNIPTYDQALDALEKGEDEVVAETLFALRVDDTLYVERVVNAVRGLLKRPSLTSHQIVAIGRALYGLERLPLRTSGINIQLSLTYTFEGDISYCNMYLTEDTFSTDSGSISGSGFDRNSFSGPKFYVEPHYREYDGFDLLAEEWPNEVEGMTEAELSLVDISEDKAFDWNHPDGSQFWEWIAEHA